MMWKLYNSFNNSIRIVATLLLCYFCFLLSPTIAIVAISYFFIMMIFLRSKFRVHKYQLKNIFASQLKTDQYLNIEDKNIFH